VAEADLRRTTSRANSVAEDQPAPGTGKTSAEGPSPAASMSHNV
jgi:hypothetical protein